MAHATARPNPSADHLDFPEARDLAEVERSATEASRVVLQPVQVDRYLAPPADTAYGLEYAFYCLGNVGGKTVLDLGCGHGENSVVLAAKGARVIGIDISPQLISLAEERLRKAGYSAVLKVASAYDTGLPDQSVDAVFCVALLHHLVISRACEEIYRVLRPNGLFVMSEPVRFSGAIRQFRKAFPAARGQEVSPYEYPLNSKQVAEVRTRFTVIRERSFTLPFVPLFRRLDPRSHLWTRKIDRWLLAHMPVLEHYAGSKVISMTKA